MIRTKFVRAAGCLLAGVMMFTTMATTSFAHDKEEQEEFSVKFTKTLNMDDAVGASIPDVTFGFSVAPGTAVAATLDNPEILAGVGTPTIADVVFGTDDKTVKDVVVNFDNVAFTKPGIYRYVVTESSTVTGAVAADIVADANAVRYLDVYVENDEDSEDGLAMTNYVLLESQTTPEYGDSGLTYDVLEKVSGYENSYVTYDLNLTKKVVGAMGNLSQQFTFKVVFNGPANASFTYGNNKITLDENGQGSTTIQLASGKSALIQGLPSSVTYQVTEMVTAKEGYDVSATKTIGKNTQSLSVSQDEDTYSVVETQTMGKADQTVQVTNTKDSLVPTGVVMHTAPYIIAIIVAGATAFLFFFKKRDVELA